MLNYGSPTTNTRDATFETSGYAAYGMESGGTKGYTHGPGYWGKTFFHWPPDPTNDWRKLYFTYPSSATAMDDNSRLWDSNGNWQAPSSSTYAINYTAILNWLKNIGPNPFPTQLRVGADRLLHDDPIDNRHLELAAERPEPAVLEGLHRLLSGPDSTIEQ